MGVLNSCSKNPLFTALLSLMWKESQVLFEVFHKSVFLFGIVSSHKALHGKGEINHSVTYTSQCVHQLSKSLNGKSKMTV
jgi:hypothetical protein